jgi:hypothetical protein
MSEKNAIKAAVVSAILVGLSACAEHNDNRKAVAPTPVKPAVTDKVDQCPQGVESLWHVEEGNGKTTAFAVSKVDGVMRFTLGGYQEQIYVNGKPQQLTPKEASLKPAEVTARCENQVVYMTEKDETGNVKESEWRLNAEEGMGNLTIKANGLTQVLVLRKLLVPDGGY